MASPAVRFTPREAKNSSFPLGGVNPMTLIAPYQSFAVVFRWF